MIFYLSFASRPNKLHHKYFRMSGLAPYSLQYIIFLSICLSFHTILSKEEIKIQNLKRFTFKIKDTSQLQRLWIEMGNSNIFQTCKKFSKFKSLWIKKNMWNQINYTYRRSSFIPVVYYILKSFDESSMNLQYGRENHLVRCICLNSFSFDGK